MQIELNNKSYTLVKEVCLMDLKNLSADMIKRNWEPKEYYFRGVRGGSFMAWKSLKDGHFSKVR